MIQLLPEFKAPGLNRLGRHIEHDPASHAFRLVSSGPLHTRAWQRHCAPFDQGDLGSCTGNAMAGAKMTGPLFKPGLILGEDEAVQLYELATTLDDVPGNYPPDDTGSSGLAVAKAAVQKGYITGYRHAMGIDDALYALTLGPVIAGITWWSGFDSPVGTYAHLEISGYNRGGHEVCLDGIDVEHRLVHGTNSWGKRWGNQGKFCMSFATFARLLRDNGDVVAPH